MFCCVHLVRELKYFTFIVYTSNVLMFQSPISATKSLKILRSYFGLDIKRHATMSNAFPWLYSSSQFTKTYKLCKHSNVLTNPRLLLVHYLNLQQKDIYRKRKCWKFAGADILRFSCVTVSCKVACASKRNMLFPIKIMCLPSFMLFSKSLCISFF